MPVRIPVKIFKLSQASKTLVDTTPSRNVPDVTTDDIQTSADNTKTLNNYSKTPYGQPLGQPQAAIINQDATGTFIMTNDGHKLYITDNISTNNNAIALTIKPFVFYVNPQRVTPVYQKLQTPIRTRGGWEIQHWGDALTDLTIEGKSGGMHRYGSGAPVTTQTTIQNINDVSQQGQSPAGNGTGGLRGADSIMNTTAWQRLTELKQLYDADHAIRNQLELQLLGISIYDSFYVGYFVNFNGPNQDANEPYQFSYSFTLKILYETTVTSNNPQLKAAVTSGTQTTILSPSNLNTPQ